MSIARSGGRGHWSGLCRDSRCRSVPPGSLPFREGSGWRDREMP